MVWIKKLVLKKGYAVERIPRKGGNLLVCHFCLRENRRFLKKLEEHLLDEMQRISYLPDEGRIELSCKNPDKIASALIAAAEVL